MTKTANRTVGISGLRYRLHEWFELNGQRPERMVWYTQDQWIAKGETVGAGAVLSIVIESSPFMGLINYDNSTTAMRVLAEFDKFMESLGYWYEIGYVWSIHFYIND